MSTSMEEAPVASSTSMPTNKEMKVPDWDEHAVSSPSNTATRSSFKTNVGRKFDATFPPHKRYLGRFNRKVFLIAIAAMLLAVLALIVGLAAGLAHHGKHSSQALPAGAQTFTGDMTYFTPALGSCGMDNKDSDKIAAVSHELFDVYKIPNPNNNPLCGRMIRITRFDEAVGQQRSVDVKVVDRCPVCKKYDLDLSPGAFDELANEAQGRVTMHWSWL